MCVPLAKWRHRDRDASAAKEQPLTITEADAGLMVAASPGHSRRVATKLLQGLRAGCFWRLPVFVPRRLQAGAEAWR